MELATNLFAILFTISAFVTLYLVIRHFKRKRKIKKDFLHQEKVEISPEESLIKMRKKQIIERKKKLIPILIFGAITLISLIILLSLGVIYYG